jgi:hypothetical protein
VEGDWAKGLGWEERELWNFWNLASMTSETVGILRSLCLTSMFCLFNFIMNFSNFYYNSNLIIFIK